MSMTSNKKAFTLIELLISSAILVTILTAVLTGFILVKHIFATSIAQSTLQRDAEVMMGKLIQGKAVSGGIRLSEARSVFFYADISRLTFIGPDGVIRRTYSLNTDGTALLYSEENGVQNLVIHTAPQGAVITLEFGPMNVGPPLCSSVYVRVSRVMNGRTVTGALKSSVYLRNHPV
jgi:prepilin-type N-terminal cleavage/methylation domain-containing protein